LGLLSPRRDDNGKASQFAASAAPPLLRACPGLWEFLACPVWEESGEHRELGSLLIFAQDGVLKFMLNDRDSNKVAFRTFGGSQDLLRQVEEALLSDDTDWRVSKAFSRRK
jgi:hypothetical protein